MYADQKIIRDMFQLSIQRVLKYTGNLDAKQQAYNEGRAKAIEIITGFIEQYDRIETLKEKTDQFHDIHLRHFIASIDFGDDKVYPYDFMGRTYTISHEFYDGVTDVSIRIKKTINDFLGL